MLEPNLNFRFIVIATLALLGSSAAFADDPPPIFGRSFDRFQFDPVVNHGLWAEPLVDYSREENRRYSGHVDVLRAGPRVAFGWRFLEGGLILPSMYVYDDSHNYESGVSDIHLYGKIVPLEFDIVRAGGGIDVSLPSGDEGDGLGTGQAGFTPFATVAVRGGPVDVRGHIGYQAFTGSGFPDDAVVYGAGVFVDLARFAIARLELVGQDFDHDGSAEGLEIEPGCDFRIPIRRIAIWLRPTVAAGLTDEAPDWGLRFSVAVTWSPAGLED